MMQKINRAKKSALLVLVVLLAFSCAPKTKEIPPPTEPPDKKLSAEEQNNMAMLEYEKILEEITERGKRNMLPELEKSHRDVIARYPEAFLAQESYWRLVEMNLINYNPPRLDNAERIRTEFVARYPNSRMIKIIDDSIVRFYHRRQYWKRLLNICSYHVKNYIETGKLESPLFMFYYAEAKLNLKDLIEAEKAYKIILRLFPGSHEAKIAKQKVREINMSKRITDR
jgi:outer membrane protein assembly factor BamD (BamD/ComL family)